MPYGVVLDTGDLNESFDSCFIATLTVSLSGTIPSCISLLPIILALNCRTVIVLSSLICSIAWAGDGGCGGGGGPFQTIYCTSAYDVPGTKRTRVLGSRIWIRTNVARHPKGDDFDSVLSSS